VIVFTLLLFSGCSGNNSNSGVDNTCNDIASTSNIDESNSSINSGDEMSSMDWPTAGLPSGFPKYPNGDIAKVDNTGNGVIMSIGNTDKATYDAYKSTLALAGWEFEDSDKGTTEVSAANGDWGLILDYEDDGTVTIMVNNYGGN